MPGIKKQKNDYVIYYDTRSENPVLYGFLYEGGNTYLIRHFNIKTKEDIILKVTYEETKDEIVSKEIIVVKGKEQIEAYVEYLYDFFFLLNIGDSIDRSKFPDTIYLTQEVKSDNDVVNKKYTFDYWVPLFNMRKLEHENGGSLTLLTFGKNSESLAKRFYSITNYPKYVDGPSFEITKRKEKNLKYGSVKMRIDDSWKCDESALLLSVKTPRDAFIMFEHFTIDEDKIKTFNQVSHFIGFHKMISDSFYVLADTVNVSTIKNTVIFEYYIYNTQDKMVTRVVDTYKMIDNTLYNINLFSYATLYKDNQKYFDGIIQDIIDSE
jgi:hypothetical protein